MNKRKDQIEEASRIVDEIKDRNTDEKDVGQPVLVLSADSYIIRSGLIIRASRQANGGYNAFIHHLDRCHTGNTSVTGVEYLSSVVKYVVVE